MQRFLSLILTLLLVVALCACQPEQEKPFYAQSVSLIDRVLGKVEVEGLTLTLDNYVETELTYLPQVDPKSIEFAADGSVLADKLNVGLVIQKESLFGPVGDVKQVKVYRADEKGNKLETDDALLANVYDFDTAKSLLIEQVKPNEHLYVLYAAEDGKDRYIYEMNVHWELKGKNTLHIKGDRLRYSKIPLKLVNSKTKQNMNLEIDYEFALAYNEIAKTKLEQLMKKNPEWFSTETREKLESNLSKNSRFFIGFGEYWSAMLNATGMILEDGTAHLSVWHPFEQNLELGKDWVLGLITTGSVFGLKKDGTLEVLSSNLTDDGFFQNSRYDILTDVVSMCHLSGGHGDKPYFLLKDGTLLCGYNGDYYIVIDENVVKLEQPNYGHISSTYLRSDNKIIAYDFYNPDGDLIAEIEDWTKVRSYSVGETKVTVTLKDGTTQTYPRLKIG